MTLGQRVVGDLGAVGCWLVVWVVSVTVCATVVSWVMQLTTEGRAIYLAGVVFGGVMVFSPVGLACSTFFLWVKRRLRLLIACGVLVGLGATLWPFLIGDYDAHDALRLWCRPGSRLALSLWLGVGRATG